MKIRTWVVLLGLAALWVLAGCGGAAATETPASPAPELDNRAWLGTPFATAAPVEGISPTFEPPRSTPTQRPQRPASATPMATVQSQPVSLPLADPLPSLTPTPTLSFVEQICSPLEFVELQDLPRVVSDRYHPPPMGSDARHQGVDFAYYQWKGKGLLEGTPVRSVFTGRVAASVKDSFPFGNMLIVETGGDDFPEDVREIFGIDPGESLYLLYAHMQAGSPLKSLGEQVRRCEPLGTIGRSGNADAAHLHLEMRVGPAGTVFAGFSAFRDTDTPEEKQNYRRWRIGGEFLHFDPMRMLLFEYSHGATATPTPDKRD